ncbi:hypothetical protein BYT27DRAFT_7202967 [Phlegmacium glaucopus]|nr:hypothetical protein BYT27DRAFT_7202967 [Phlegmacium glaucopus]
MWTVTRSHQDLMNLYYFGLGLKSTPLDLLCFVTSIMDNEARIHVFLNAGNIF